MINSILLIFIMKYFEIDACIKCIYDLSFIRILTK